MEEEKMDIAEKLIAKARELDAIILAGYEKIAESDAFTQRIESAVEDQLSDIEDQIKSAVEDALYSWDIAESDAVKETLTELVEAAVSRRDNCSAYLDRFHALEDQIKKLPADVEALVEIRLAEQQRPMTPIDQSFGRVEKRIAQLDINQQRHEKALADSRLEVMDKLDELENFIAKQFKQTEVMAKLEEIMGQFRLADIGPIEPS